MNNHVLKFILIIASIYVALLFVSDQFANFCLAVFCVLLIPGLFLRNIFMDSLYKGSINLVSKRFVFNQNTIRNEHCTVKYTPDVKLVVMENISNRKKETRTFTLRKEDRVNVNKCWNEVCKIFDSFINIDSLASFLSYDAKINIVTIPSIVEKVTTTTNDDDIKIDSTNVGPKFIEMGSIQPDTYSKGLEHQRAFDEKFVNIDNINPAQKSKEREEAAPVFIDMSEALDKGPNKIDINNDGADEIAVLPGINIVMAKKIVEYRASNGLFKNADDFIKIANVKEHFIPKIKSMIIVGEPKKIDNGGDDDQGRVVDI